MDTTPNNSSIINFKVNRLEPKTKTAPPKMLHKKHVWPLLLCFFTMFAALFLLNKMLMPKYMSGIYEGALISEYYAAEKNHDLIIIGDCEVYENISPITLWEDYGITSYIRGSPQQLIWQSYYLLEDTFKYEKPQAVIFSVFSMKYGQPQSEAYNRLTLDGMRFSAAKIAAISASLTEGENLVSYLFPLFRYHDRWKELAYEDILYMFSRRKVSHNGFMMRCDIKPQTLLPTPPKLGDYTFSENCWKYLDKMTQLCKQNNVELILLKTPVLYPHWYQEWDEQISSYAKTHGLLYINAINDLDNISLDFSCDTYDGGLHLNLAGAEKFSKYLGKALGEYGLPDQRLNMEISSMWEEKINAYNALKNTQLTEIEATGKVSTFTRE